MQLKEIMTPNVETIHPKDPIREAARKMKSLDVGSLPVCDNRKMLGMVTDRDITIRAVAEGRDPDSTQAAKVMEQQQIRRLPILDREKRLVGIVSLGDLAVRGTSDKMSGEVLEEISEPARPDR
jgi:CBS domain-containing protein